MKVDRLFDTAERVLRAVGIEVGQDCLDFGCGHGNYAIALARVVGPEGTVYALDKETSALGELAERARTAGLANIRTIESSDLKIPLADGSVNVILLYDILHSHYFTAGKRESLFREMRRIARPEALLSVFPHHMEKDEIAKEVVRRAWDFGFRGIGEYKGPVVHDDGIIEGHIMTFRKGATKK